MSFTFFSFAHALMFYQLKEAMEGEDDDEEDNGDVM